MDGLECKELPISEVRRTYDFRIESEFWKKEYTAIQEKLERMCSKRLCDGLVDFIADGTHYTPDYTNTGIPFLSALNVQENYLDLNAGYKYISLEQHKELIRRVLPQANDVLLRKVGVGKRKACVVPKNIFEFSIFVSVALIRSKINPYILSAFINSKYGQAQLIRFNKGISQPDLHLEDIGRMLIPTLSEKLTDKVQSLITDAEYLIKKSQESLNHAAEFIDVFLETDTITAPASAISIKPISQSLNSSDRLDAEYYHPKYEQIEKKFGSCNTLSAVCNIYDDNFIPSDNNKYLYVELSNVDLAGGISIPEPTYGKHLPNRARRLIKSGHVIVSSIEGSLQRCALVPKELDNAICSTGFYVIDSEHYNSETLLMLFKSTVMQSLLKKRCSGTILTGISKEEFLKMPMPEIDSGVQDNIKNSVQESLQFKRNALQLLEFAVKTVEMAIDYDDDIAFKWLHSKL